LTKGGGEDVKPHPVYRNTYKSNQIFLNLNGDGSLIPDQDQGNDSKGSEREGNECDSKGAKAESTPESQTEGDITIITARARKEMRTSKINEGKVKLRMTKKTNAAAWKQAGGAE